MPRSLITTPRRGRCVLGMKTVAHRLLLFRWQSNRKGETARQSNAKQKRAERRRRAGAILEWSNPRWSWEPGKKKQKGNSSERVVWGGRLLGCRRARRVTGERGEVGSTTTARARARKDSAADYRSKRVDACSTRQLEEIAEGEGDRRRR